MPQGARDGGAASMDELYAARSQGWRCGYLAISLSLIVVRVERGWNVANVIYGIYHSIIFYI